MTLPTHACPALALTVGDPAGIGPEITLRLLQAIPPGVRLLVVGDAQVLEQARTLVDGASMPPMVDGAAQVEDGCAGLWSGSAACASLPIPGAIDAAAGAACHAWVLQAADLALAGAVDGLVTGPIHKASWHAAGVTSPGHTEALETRAGVDRVHMMLIGGHLRTALATRHVPLADVPGLLREDDLVADLELLHRETARCFGPDRPRIAVCGLNPHAGEGGLFGAEEAEVIAPAVERARALGIDAIGPLPADACLPAAVGGAYDAVLAMYHDQSLPVVKSVAPRRSVNVTLGLPFVRTSVDHGTAFDIAGRGIATASSFAAAVEMAVAIVGRIRAHCASGRE